MPTHTAHNTRLARPLALVVRVHRWWCYRRAKKQADQAAQQLDVLIGDDNVAFVRQVCFEIAREHEVYVGPCEIVQAMLAAVSASEIDLSRCGGGYAEIKRLIQGDLVAGAIDREAWGETVSE